MVYQTLPANHTPRRIDSQCDVEMEPVVSRDNESSARFFLWVLLEDGHNGLSTARVGTPTPNSEFVVTR